MSFFIADDRWTCPTCGLVATVGQHRSKPTRDAARRAARDTHVCPKVPKRWHRGAVA